MKTVLLIDDQAEEFAPIWKLKLKTRDFDLVWCTDPSAAASTCGAVKPDVALVDVFFADPAGGLRERAREIIDILRRENAKLPIVLLTSKLTDQRFALDPEAQYPEAFRTHPKELLDIGNDPVGTLVHILQEAIASASARWDPLKFGIVTGGSSVMAEVIRDVERVGLLESNVLLVGETGTGKELVARAIHELSRRPGRFEPLNCGTVTETLAESRLFGARKGGFAGAQHAEGLFERADKGTLFLDEIQSAPAVVQGMLLRVIEDGQVTPVGGTTIRVDVRVIAASNQDLERLVASGAFREDLLQRVKATVISLPPLRERRKDIPALFRYWVAQLNTEMPHPCLDTLRDDVRDLLQGYLWPRNIREFRDVLRQAMLRSRSGVLQPTHFADLVVRPGLPPSGDTPVESPPNAASGSGHLDFEGLARRMLAGVVPWTEAMQVQGEYKKELLYELMSLYLEQNGDYSHEALAKRLGITSASLRQLCSKHKVYARDIKRPKRSQQ